MTNTPQEDIQAFVQSNMEKLTPEERAIVCAISALGVLAKLSGAEGAPALAAQLASPLVACLRALADCQGLDFAKLMQFRCGLDTGLALLTAEAFADANQAAQGPEFPTTIDALLAILKAKGGA